MRPSTTRNRRVRHAGAAALIALFAHDACAAAAATDYCIVGDGAIGCVNERSVIELTTRRKDASALKELVQEKLASGQCRLFGYGERVSLVSVNAGERASVRKPGDKTTYWMAASFSRPSAECEPNASAATLRHKLGLPDPNAATNSAAAGEASAEQDDGLAFAEDRNPAAGAFDDEAPFTDDEPRAFGRGRDGGPMLDDDDYRRFAQRRAVRRYSDGDPRSFALSRDDDEGYGPSARRRGPWPSRPLPSSRYAHDCAYKPVMSDADLAACRSLRR